MEIQGLDIDNLEDVLETEEKDDVEWEMESTHIQKKQDSPKYVVMQCMPDNSYKQVNIDE